MLTEDIAVAIDGRHSFFYGEYSDYGEERR